MDEYPAGSLDHAMPFLLTLGTRTGTPYDPQLSPALKEQAVLIRSELPSLNSDQASALLRYLQDRDASQLPCNGRDMSRKYRFKIQTAERVRTRQARHKKYRLVLIRSNPSSRFYCLRAVPVSQTASKLLRRCRPQCSTHHTPP
jgi:hypothetical protein